MFCYAPAALAFLVLTARARRTTQGLGPGPSKRRTILGREDAIAISLKISSCNVTQFEHRIRRRGRERSSGEVTGEEEDGTSVEPAMTRLQQIGASMSSLPVDRRAGFGRGCRPHRTSVANDQDGKDPHGIVGFQCEAIHQCTVFRLSPSSATHDDDEPKSNYTMNTFHIQNSIHKPNAPNTHAMIGGVTAPQAVF